MQILRLRDNPAFADTVADRSWNAWWTETGSLWRNIAPTWTR